MPAACGIMTTVSFPAPAADPSEIGLDYPAEETGLPSVADPVSAEAAR